MVRRCGRMVELPPIANGWPAAVRHTLETSLRVEGASLFNLVPTDLRSLEGVKVESFKLKLDTWLGQVPDQPTIHGRQRAALTNSLLGQAIPLR